MNELLAMGFGSVEFGSVLPDGVPALAATLLNRPKSADTAVGVGLSLPAESPAAALGETWLAGLNGLWANVDYLSFNLSARANRRFLHSEQLACLAGACLAVAFRRDCLYADSGRYLPLALKLPLGDVGEPLPTAALIAVAAGFDQLTLVLPEVPEATQRLAELAQRLGAEPALVAVGGIRSATAIANVRQAGAAGVQVHRLFVDQGAACLATLSLPSSDAVRASTRG